jgi:hypothetical protein
VPLDFDRVEDYKVTSILFLRRFLLCAGLTIFLGACSSTPKVTTTQELSPSAKAPYKKILVISLFSSFDSRRYLEKEIAKALTSDSTVAVASTTMMDSRVPANRETFVAMVDKIGADAVLVTQLVNLETKATVKAMSPEATQIFRPTYYYNVWSYELAEYVEPPTVAFDYQLALASQVLSVDKENTVWAIESNTNIKQGINEGPNYNIFINEATAIAKQMSRDGLVGR